MVMVAWSTLLNLEGGSGGQSPRSVIQLAEGAGGKVFLENFSGYPCSPKTLAQMSFGCESDSHPLRSK